MEQPKVERRIPEDRIIDAFSDNIASEIINQSGEIKKDRPGEIKNVSSLLEPIRQMFADRSQMPEGVEKNFSGSQYLSVLKKLPERIRDKIIISRNFKESSVKLYQIVLDKLVAQINQEIEELGSAQIVSSVKIEAELPEVKE